MFAQPDSPADLPVSAFCVFMNQEALVILMQSAMVDFGIKVPSLGKIPRCVCSW